MTARLKISRDLLGGRTPAQFLKQYWQKKPLLIRGAFPAFRDPVTPEELAGLSCEEDVESRLVMERGGKKPWHVTLGPQREAQLRALPKTHWTLLVQGVDRWIPGVAALLEPFRFIPDWRVDDVMISFAPRGGTVGPHIDSYDVFLIQGKGRRRWRTDSRAPLGLRPGLDLRILSRFNADSDWVLEPGDMLYLPPNLSHYGVALEDCLTYSIGFRSPSDLELLGRAQERVLEACLPPVRYRDPGLKQAREPGEISRSSVRRLRRLMDDALQAMNSSEFDAMIGEFLTEPKSPSDPGERRVSESALRAQLKRGDSLVRSAGSRLGYLKQEAGAVLFVDGRSIPLEASLLFAAPLLSGSRRLTSAALAPHRSNKKFIALVAQLVRSRAFRLER